MATATAKVGVWLQGMFELGCTFGWRKSEMLGLKVKQIDLPAGTIRLEPGTTKNTEGREVSMSVPLKVWLTQCCVKKGPEDAVFTREDKSPIRDFRKTWVKVCCEVGLGKLVCPACYPELKQTVDADGQCSICARKWKRQQLKYVGLLVHDLRRTASP